MDFLSSNINKKGFILPYFIYFTIHFTEEKQENKSQLGN